MRYSFSYIENCNMCGSSGQEMLGMRLNRSQGMNPASTPGVAVSVMKCRSCTLIFPNPQPVPENLSDHYGRPAENYWKPQYFERSPHYFQREIKTAKRLIGFKEGMSALDIGAGVGKAMVALQEAGFEAKGIEPSEPFREKAISHFGLSGDDILHAEVEDAEFKPESFDFITFGAVLEHLYDPGSALERTMYWLKPGGVVQIEVPSSKHLIARLINLFFRFRGVNYVTNLSPMHSPFHLYEFGLQSFLKHGEQVGYEVVEHFFSVCTIYHIPRIFHNPLRWWMKRNDTGMQLTVWLRKIGSPKESSVSFRSAAPQELL